MLLVSWLAVETIAIRLPWFLESLKVENIEIPVESSADTVRKEILSVLGGGYRGALHLRVVVVGSA